MYLDLAFYIWICIYIYIVSWLNQWNHVKFLFLVVKLNHVKSCEQLKKSFVTFLWTLKSLSRLFPGLFPGLSFGFRESSRVQLLIFAYGTPWNSLPFPAFARALARSCASDSVPQEVDASSEGFEGSEGWHSASRSESKATCSVQKHPSKYSVFIVYLCFFHVLTHQTLFFPHLPGEGC
jgi:hypothetical protein